MSSTTTTKRSTKKKKTLSEQVNDEVTEELPFSWQSEDELRRCRIAAHNLMTKDYPNAGLAMYCNMADANEVFRTSKTCRNWTINGCAKHGQKRIAHTEIVFVFYDKENPLNHNDWAFFSMVVEVDKGVVKMERDPDLYNPKKWKIHQIKCTQEEAFIAYAYCGRRVMAKVEFGMGAAMALHDHWLVRALASLYMYPVTEPSTVNPKIRDGPMFCAQLTAAALKMSQPEVFSDLDPDTITAWGLHEYLKQHSDCTSVGMHFNRKNMKKLEVNDRILNM